MKTRNTFQKALDKIDAKIQELREQAFFARQFYQGGNIKQAYESALRLEEISEKNVLLTRALPAYTGNPKAKLEIENLIKLSIPIEIGFSEEGRFSLRIPALLPDWNQRLLNLLFDRETQSNDQGSFEYDAYINGVYVLSHLDGDIARLIRFREALAAQPDRPVHQEEPEKPSRKKPLYSSAQPPDDF